MAKKWQKSGKKIILEMKNKLGIKSPSSYISMKLNEQVYPKILKIRIIDILNMISTNQHAPKKIKYKLLDTKEKTCTYDALEKEYLIDGTEDILTFQCHHINDEVEIIQY